jgi:hypothetical protein
MGWYEEAADKILEGSEGVESGCILFGHGAVTVGGRTEPARKVIYKALVGEIPTGFDVGHTCGVDACVAPDHLRILPAASPIADVVVLPQQLPTRRKRVKTDQQIRSYIINYMRQYGHSPKGLLTVLTGFITSIQDDVKRDREDEFVERACAGHHPGRLPKGIYCKLCHDAEMAGKFGQLPPEITSQMKGDVPGNPHGDVDLEFEGDDDLDLMGVKIAPPKEG